MKTATGITLIRNGQLVDGTGAPPIADAALLIENGRIRFAGPARGLPRDIRATQEIIDARSGTIMPGLVEAHFHPTYFNVAALEDLDIKYPVEYVTLLAATNARLALASGYTAARSGGSLFNVDVWLKKAIENDLVPGPRLAASGREICGAGSDSSVHPVFSAAKRPNCLWSRNLPAVPRCRSSTAGMVQGPELGRASKAGAGKKKPPKPAWPGARPIIKAAGRLGLAAIT